MRARSVLPAVLSIFALAGPATAADISCNGLVTSGETLICSGFEPNWAVELSCVGDTMQSSFIDAFSGNDIQTTPGTVTFASEDPWVFETSHGIEGSIGATPGECRDEGDNIHDFTFTPTAAPGLPGPFFPFCCRMR